MKIKTLDIILAITLLATVVSSFAYTWQPTIGPVPYGAIRMSADGRIIFAVPSADHPALSTDSGNTWNFVTNNLRAAAVYPGQLAMFADGSKIFTVLSSNFISTALYESSDHGTNWSPTGFPSTMYFSNCPVACSADGSIVVAATGIGPIYYSTNGGVSCMTSSVPNAKWSSIASSADGSHMVAGVDGGNVYFSTDFGATWIPGNLSAQFWTSVCISADGSRVGAISSTDSYISGNSGATWLTNHIAGKDIACSVDGSRWLIVGNQIYTSTNSGATWQTNLVSAQWSAGAMSADGGEIAVSGTAQGTHVGTETISPNLNAQLQGSAIALSWIIPSTNFVLQESSNLTTWTAITNSPALNFTNLHDEVNLPVTNSYQMFRLISQ